MKKVNELFIEIIPMYNIGLGWVFPALIGGLIGLFISLLRKNGNISPIKSIKKLSK
ncbi:hypothetical protein [Priestia aryabhattai]